MIRGLTFSDAARARAIEIIMVIQVQLSIVENVREVTMSCIVFCRRGL